MWLRMLVTLISLVNQVGRMIQIDMLKEITPFLQEETSIEVHIWAFESYFSKPLQLLLMTGKKNLNLLIRFLT